MLGNIVTLAACSNPGYIVTQLFNAVHKCSQLPCVRLDSLLDSKVNYMNSLTKCFGRNVLIRKDEPVHVTLF